MKRWIGFGALAVIGLLAVADWAYWRIVTQRVQIAIEQWEAGARAEGWEIETGPFTPAGWPMAAELVVPNVSLRHGRQSVPGAVTVSAPAVTVSVPLLRPEQPALLLQSPLHFQVADQPDMILTADRLMATAGPRRSGATPIALQGQQARLETAEGAWHAAIHQLAIDLVLPTPDRGAPPTGKLADYVVRTDGVTLPNSTRWPLGPTIASLQLEGTVHGTSPPSGAITRWAMEWRSNGGTVEVSRFALDWGPLAVAGSATLALDEHLQPAGTGNARLSGYAESLDRLAAVGLLSRSAATTAKALLSLMAGLGRVGASGTGGGGGASTVDLPLVLQDRTLFMQQVPLLRVPQLDWPPIR